MGEVMVGFLIGVIFVRFDGGGVWVVIFGSCFWIDIDCVKICGEEFMVICYIICLVGFLYVMCKR